MAQQEKEREVLGVVSVIVLVVLVYFATRRSGEKSGLKPTPPSVTAKKE